jgi:hypothetical protein
MILSLLLASMSLQGSVRRVEVCRGESIPSADLSVPSYAYWDCEDTTLDSTDPEATRGGEASLVGGQSSVILIRFGDLSRVLGRTRHIRKASIVFTMVSGAGAVVSSAERVLQPWGEGPYQTINATLKLLGQQSSSDAKGKLVPAKMAATWKARQAGFDNGNWQQPGAKGPLDGVSIPGAAAFTIDNRVEIRGLEGTFQWLADHPTHNNGIALGFSNPCEFASAQAVEGRPRLELELDDAPAQSGPDLSVVSISARAEGGFSARVKNVGGSAATGFDAIWTVDGRVGSSVNHPDALAPGQEVTLTTTDAPRLETADPRSGTVCLDIKPAGPDANAANDSLSIFPAGRRLDFTLAPGVVALAAKTENLEGTRSIEDWLQGQIRIFNETYLTQSHYSFALDGCKERVLAQSINLGDGESPGLKGGAQVVVTAEMFGNGGFSPKLARAIGSAIGLIDYGAMNISARSPRVAVPGASDRGTEDLFGGLMGGGDTRFDGSLAGVLMMPNEPSYSVEGSPVSAEPTGLLTMTDVYMLDAGIGKPTAQGLPGVSPKAILLQARDLLNRPLGGLALSFYQSSDSKIVDGPPTFKLSLGDSGDGVIQSRESQGIFGRLEPDGSNGLLLVKAEDHGVTEWSWIKAWQIVDAYARGISSAAILDLTFDLPGSALEPNRDLASQRFVSDSTGQSPDKLASIVDGDGKQLASLGQKVGDWVEVDLGRDRTLAEIRVSAPADRLWQAFDVLLYGTGQTPRDALVFARERDWAYSRKNRSDGAESSATVSYRGLPVQARYIRIVNRSGGAGEIGKISVIPAKLSN